MGRDYQGCFTDYGQQVTKLPTLNKKEPYFSYPIISSQRSNEIIRKIAPGKGISQDRHTDKISPYQL